EPVSSTTHTQWCSLPTSTPAHNWTAVIATSFRLSANIIPTDNPASISLNKRSHRRSQSAAREVQAGRAASPFKPHHQGRQHTCSLTRPTRVTAQRNNTKQL